jgi:hypothetical protein
MPPPVATPAPPPSRRSRRDSRAPRAGLALFTAALLAGAVALVACPSRDTDQQQWDEDAWGSVIPHDSFPADCSLCHITERWDEIREDFSFDHEEETGFALTGAHADAACLRCHNDRGPVQMFVDHGCAGCHVDPHEGELGSQCTDCHNDVTWEPTGLILQHQQTRFPLYGSHMAVACNQCHERSDIGDFTGAPVECAACHTTEAATVTVPDHTTNGWLDDCEECHSATKWAPTHYPHPYFPLTGPHRIRCDNCHSNPADYTIFSCTTGCHDQPKTDEQHTEVTGYTYSDAACYSCHRDGGD